MRLGAALGLVRLSLARDRRGAFSSAFGIAIGVAALVFFIALGLGVGRVVREKVFPLDASLVEVVPPKISLGLLGGGRIDQPAVERLAALEGVEHAYRKMNVRVPAVSVYDGDFFGRRLRMGVEVLAVGVDADFIRHDVQLGKFEDGGPDAPIPSVVAARLLEIYNKTFAPARSLPTLSAQMIAGFAFPVDINRSFVAVTPPGPVIHTQMQVVGVSERGLLAGVVIPLPVAVRLNRASGADAESFSAVTLKAASPSEVPRLVEKVKEMGFRVDDLDRRMAENAGAAVTITTSALALLSALICLLAAFNIAHALSASVRARERELAVMRAVGASSRDIFALVLLEAAALGVLGAALGVGLALGASVACDWASVTALPPFPFKPDTFFEWSPTLLAGGLGLGLVASLGGAWLPALRAARLDPARALAG